MCLCDVAAELVRCLPFHSPHISAAGDNLPFPDGTLAALQEEVILRPEEEVGDQWAADPVVPRLWLLGQGLAPHLADVAHVVCVVEVNLWEGFLALHAGHALQVHLDLFRAWTAFQCSFAPEDSAFGSERPEEGILVLRLCVGDKGGPVRLANPLPHLLRNSRRGLSEEVAPPFGSPVSADSANETADGADVLLHSATESKQGQGLRALHVAAAEESVMAVGAVAAVSAVRAVGGAYQDAALTDVTLTPVTSTATLPEFNSLPWELCPGNMGCRPAPVTDLYHHARASSLDWVAPSRSPLYCVAPFSLHRSRPALSNYRTH